jgi:hypothetical protein
MPNSTSRPLTGRRVAVLAAACTGAAALSVALPFTPLFDPWGWLVWGRELWALELDTGAGPSWKPLPALICAVLAPAGDAAPDLWLVVARAAWLAVPALAWALAARIDGTGGRRAWAAGALAAAGVVLAHDAFTSTARQFTGGLSEPLLAALVLGAILAALERRSALALWLGFVACLLRPEAWPFAALFAWHEVRAGRASGGPVAVAGVGIALAWFVPDLLGAGDALEGAGRAREASGTPPVEFAEVLGRALVMAPALLWAGAAAAVLAERRLPGRHPAGALATGATAWIGLVALMAAAGYAGLPRFMAPAVAVVCALGGAGLVAIASDRRLPAAALVAAAALLAADLGWRAAAVPGELDRARSDAASVERLRALVRDEREELRGCPPIASTDFLVQTATAWELELPVSEVRIVARYPHAGTLITGPGADPGMRVLPRLAGERLATAGEWEAFRTGSCAGR